MGNQKNENSLEDSEKNNYSLTEDEKSILWRRVDRSVRLKRKHKLYTISSVAAAILLVAGSTFYLSKKEVSKTGRYSIKEIAENAISAVDQQEGVSFVEISKNQMDSLYIVGVKSIDHSDNTFSLSEEDLKASYSSIYVPYGKRQEVRLSDGTMVWLNAGSQLTFPNTFESHERVVYLVGEGYFDIAHKGTPFKVLTAQNCVEVLGTTFNLSSYPEDDFELVELLTGSISFQSQQGKFDPIVLNPSEELEMNQKTNHIKIRKGSRGNSILWTKKQLELNNTTLSHLFRKLERVYNVRIKDDNLSNLSSSLYSGRLDMSADLASVLNAIYELRNYDIQIIKKEVFMIKK